MSVGDAPQVQSIGRPSLRDNSIGLFPASLDSAGPHACRLPLAPGSEARKIRMPQASQDHDVRPLLIGAMVPRFPLVGSRGHRISEFPPRLVNIWIVLGDVVSLPVLRCRCFCPSSFFSRPRRMAAASGRTLQYMIPKFKARPLPS